MTVKALAIQRTRISALGWLLSVGSGAVLLAYVFVLPALTDVLVLEVIVAAATLVLGVGLIQDGILAAMSRRTMTSVPALPLMIPRRFAGGFLLLGYLLVYVPPQGRQGAYWPLEFTVTLLFGIATIVDGILAP